ncbi:MAG TPA: alanine racemase [Bacteroidales bacterium]|nr:alanine racemase [Bacteroidales bacterium]
MAYITLNAGKLKENYRHLDRLFKSHKIKWSVVSKLLSGNTLFLRELLNLKPEQVCDSRVSNLKTIKTIDPSVETIYIKPPPKQYVKAVVEFADISLNTEFETIRMLSEEARKQKKNHKVIIMIEMGELREGVMREDFIDFFSKVFELPNIEVVGIGTNLTCLYGVLPNQDKLIQLGLYEQLVEARFNKEIPYVSGGSSVTIPLIHQGILPEAINHFRVGETLFLGTNVYDGSVYQEMHNDVFRLYTEIIELTEKPRVPTGEMGVNVDGESFEFNENDIGKTSWRAIVDMGLLDVDEKHISLVEDDLELVGASSDMFVIDLGENKNNYKVGDIIEFRMDYMGVVRILNSKYIEKRISK